MPKRKQVNQSVAVSVPHRTCVLELLPDQVEVNAIGGMRNPRENVALGEDATVCTEGHSGPIELGAN
jgi:hypothetical protein